MQKNKNKTSMHKDYYKILEIPKTASAEEIKKAYRKLALKYHPDKQEGKPDHIKKENEEKFKEISEAYAALTNPDHNQEHYRQGTNRSAAADWQDIQDMYDQFFRNSRNNEAPNNNTDTRTGLFVTVQLPDGRWVQIKLGDIKGPGQDSTDNAGERMKQAFKDAFNMNNRKMPDEAFIDFIEKGGTNLPKDIHAGQIAHKIDKSIQGFFNFGIFTIKSAPHVIKFLCDCQQNGQGAINLKAIIQKHGKKIINDDSFNLTPYIPGDVLKSCVAFISEKTFSRYLTDEHQNADPFPVRCKNAAQIIQANPGVVCSNSTEIAIYDLLSKCEPNNSDANTLYQTLLTYKGQCKNWYTPKR